MAYVPLRKAVEFLGLHPHTLRKYADEGKIESIKNEAGQRLYNVESYQRDATQPAIVCYCRVSSTKQQDDLQRQVDFMRERYPTAEIVTDVGSGLNFKRKLPQKIAVATPETKEKLVQELQQWLETIEVINMED